MSPVTDNVTSPQGQYEGKHWVTTTPGVPPLVSTNVPLLDMGNCTPRFIRSAFYTIPATKELANQMNMPISKSLYFLPAFNKL
jgi:protein transport protein SEC24